MCKKQMAIVCSGYFFLWGKWQFPPVRIKISISADGNRKKNSATCNPLMGTSVEKSVKNLFGIEAACQSVKCPNCGLLDCRITLRQVYQRMFCCKDHFSLLTSDSRLDELSNWMNLLSNFHQIFYMNFVEICVLHLFQLFKNRLK